ncbi:TRAP transporter fused permease subunit [uncultured Devosia sp.]|uniref:TRAP transporter permease n=1 Tax=uncultured Devosia sp. TaxID=211434 RepID=UPI0034137A50
MQDTRPEVPRYDLRLRVALILSFVMALIPLAHKMPAIGPLPSLGPFEAEPFRASVMAFCLLICIILQPLGQDRGGKARSLGLLADAVLLTVGLWACWRFYVDVTAMHTSIAFFEEWQAWTALGACVVLIIMTWRIWGAALAIVSSTALAWFLWVFRDDWVQAATENLWLVLDDGVLGNVTDIVLSTVFPFIILGAMLEGTGAGGSMIRVSYHLMRRFRGGPAHAAILASALFGSISGSAVANVVGTGVITIPLIKRRRFSPEFAGGVEAAASTGGQVMPPIMGAAALVMADLLGLNYLLIITAALVPALAYYGALFASVIFECRRLNVEVAETVEADLAVSAQDWSNLILVVAPVLAIVTSLLMGMSPTGAALSALALLIPLSFLNPEVRRRPFALVVAFARGGLSFAKLMMAVGAIGIVIASMSSTGLPTTFALQLDAISSSSLFMALIVAALGCIALGMGMPTLPAYLTIIIISGSSMMALGLAPLTAHFFVFYFGVASAITPPVAIAAYAAASISGGNPLRTGTEAVRIGAAIFAIPFMFTFNPEMLVVSQAAADVGPAAVLLVIFRTGLMIWMLTSAANRFDARQLHRWEIALRLALAVALIVPAPPVHWVAIVVTLGLVVWHRYWPSISAARGASS